MKAIVLALALMMSATASAEWVVRATSPTAFGVGISLNLEMAKRIALNECSMRTPRYQVCSVDRVEWVQ